jgi:hypothetical protein
MTTITTVVWRGMAIGLQKTQQGDNIGIECANEDHGPVAIRFHVDRMRGRSAEGPDKMRRSLGGLIESVCNTQSSLSRNGNGSK